MADKDITIGLKTTGADPAAAEVKKVSDALGTSGANGGLAGGATAASKGLDEYAKTAPKVNAASFNMRSSIQNVAFQFQDIAVQAEMGVDAVRIFSQQVPQLLGGFGPVGAVLGAVVGLGVPLAAALFGAGKEAKDAVPKIDDLNKILEANKQVAEAVADAKRADANKEWIESLDEEEKSYKNINEELLRQIALNARIRAQKEKTDEAVREASIADIEADPNKTATQKIKEVAALREQGARAKIEAEKAALEDEKNRAFAEASTAQELAGRQADDLERAEAARKGAEARLADLQARSAAADKAGRQVPELEKQLRDLGAGAVAGSSIGTPFSAAELDARIKRQKELERQLEEAKKTAREAPAIAEQLLPAAKNAEELKAGEEANRKQAEAARAAAETAFRKSVISADAQAAESPLIDTRAEAERRQRQRREEIAVRAADERAKQEAKRDADAATRDRLAESQGRLDTAAGIEGDRLRKRGIQGGDKTAETIGRSLQDGTSNEELQRLANDAKAAIDANKTASGALLLEIITGLQSQARELEVMKQQLKNKK